jgi:hypothetical protein
MMLVYHGYPYASPANRRPPAAVSAANEGLTTVLNLRRRTWLRAKIPIRPLSRSIPSARQWRPCSTSPTALSGHGAMAVTGMLEDTCRSAGVLLGKYDEQVLFLLASWEPATCAVVVGLIRRARAAGLEQGSNILGASGVVLPGGGWISGPSR